MAKANGLAIIPENSEGVKAGEKIEVQMLDWAGPERSVEEGEIVPVVSIVGKSKSGKTVLMERIIAELKRKGYKVAAVKHSRGGIEMDHPGKDSWRFAQAGSDAVLVSSPGRLAFIRSLDHDLAVEEILPIVGPGFDLVLVEGFKRSKTPKIEVHRKALGGDLLFSPEELIAVVTDEPLDTNVVQFPWDDAVGVAHFIERNFVLNR
jgi:molybdopterin-guanine dinucleotide biosynthesis protein B